MSTSDQLRSPIFYTARCILPTKKMAAMRLIGSSNFTRRGLGGAAGANVEINLATDGADICNDLRIWFDELWDDLELTKDVKYEVLAALARLGEDFPPEQIYYKTSLRVVP